ncbi:MAG: hypothetical protein EXR70_05470 [Deltaproteobacteria bacterium]|nr:hypothetical protein [Deltaproteobacteria bacterium]
MLAAKAPHPNAARLFYDFLLSKEGQEMLRGFQRISCAKTSIPTRQDFSAALRSSSKIPRTTKTSTPR